MSLQVRTFLKTPQAKAKLTDKFGSKEGELPDMERASGTWEWVKRHIDDAFDNRLTDFLQDWDKDEHVIQSIEKKLFREAKLELCELENELAEVENEAQTESKERNHKDFLSSSGVFLNNLCRSIEDFDDNASFDMVVPKKLFHHLTSRLSKAIKKKQDQSKLKDYEKDPRKVAKKRAETLLSKIIEKDERLEIFVREFLQRPFNYIRRLENKIPSLIETNMSLLERLEKALIEDSKGSQQFLMMMEKVETLRSELLKYGEHHFYVNDFEANEIEIISYRHTKPPLKKIPTEMEFLIKSAGSFRPSPHHPHGIWHSGKCANTNTLFTCTSTKKLNNVYRIYL